MMILTGLESLREANAASWTTFMDSVASGEPRVALSVVVPAYNEEERLPLKLRETLGYLSRRAAKGLTWELVVVDDGSTDGTSEVVRRAASELEMSGGGGGMLRLVQQPANGGKGSAVGAGVCSCSGDLILMADADGATKIADVERLEQRLAETALTRGDDDSSRSTRTRTGRGSGLRDALGVVVGSRAHLQQDAVAERSLFRTVLMHGFHALVFTVVGDKIKDTQCGFKLFTRRAALLLFRNMRLRRWCFDVEIISLALTMHIPVDEVSVNWMEVAGSKLRPLSALHMAWELLLIFVGYRLVGTWKIL